MIMSNYIKATLLLMILWVHQVSYAKQVDLKPYFKDCYLSTQQEEPMKTDGNESCKKAITEAKKLYGENSDKVAKIHHNLAKLYISTFDFENAKSNITESLRIYQLDKSNQFVKDEYESMMVLATINSFLGENKKARLQLDKAKKKAEGFLYSDAVKLKSYQRNSILNFMALAEWKKASQLSQFLDDKGSLDDQFLLSYIHISTGNFSAASIALNQIDVLMPTDANELLKSQQLRLNSFYEFKFGDKAKSEALIDLAVKTSESASNSPNLTRNLKLTALVEHAWNLRMQANIFNKLNKTPEAVNSMNLAKDIVSYVFGSNSKQLDYFKIGEVVY